MATYTWQGKSLDGGKVKGEIEAANIQQVFNLLKKQKIRPDIKKIKEKGKGMNTEIKVPGMGPKIKVADIVIFTRQFATMIDAGLPVVQAMSILAKQHQNPKMRSVLSNIRDEVESGGTLAEAIAKHPKDFDTLFVNMIAAGEMGGILDIILERLAQYLEKAYKLKKQIKSAMIYPAIVVSAAFVVTGILLVFVIPTFADMFSDFGAALPAPTRIVMSISDFVIKHGFSIVGTMIAGFSLFKRFARTERGKKIIHPILLKIPVFGDLTKKAAVARFSRTMSTMLSSGVPIIETLGICAKTSGNKVVEHEVAKIQTSIAEGKTISEPLFESQIFPPMVVQMISVGESTGALDLMLSKIADFYEDEVENAVATLKQLIEPIMILTLGVLIGGLVIAMYLPIFKMGAVVG